MDEYYTAAIEGYKLVYAVLKKARKFGPNLTSIEVSIYHNDMVTSISRNLRNLKEDETESFDGK